VKDFYLVLTVTVSFAALMVLAEAMFFIFASLQQDFNYWGSLRQGVDHWLYFGQTYWPVGVIDWVLLVLSLFTYRKYKQQFLQ
jgi:hypothetical protein